MISVLSQVTFGYTSNWLATKGNTKYILYIYLSILSQMSISFFLKENWANQSRTM